MIVAEYTSLFKTGPPGCQRRSAYRSQRLANRQFDPRPAKVLINASDMSLSPAPTLCHHKSYILGINISREAKQGRFAQACPIWLQGTGFAYADKVKLDRNRAHRGSSSTSHAHRCWIGDGGCFGGTQAAACCIPRPL